MSLPSWINKGSNELPEWLNPHVVKRREPNGSLMIRTKCGKETAQARVLVGHIVVERSGTAYTRFPHEMRSLMADMDLLETPVHQSKAISHPRRTEAEVADRRDDTDDITRRIRAEQATVLKVQHPAPPAPSRRGKPTAAPIFQKADPRTAPARGSMPSIEWVQLDRLLVDDSYQRSTDTGPSRALIARIGREWDWRLCVPLMVSRRSEGLFVIDGQHRLYGARRRRDIPQLPCCISVYDGPADEAAMFVAANRERRAMNRLDDFHAAQAGGDAEALAVTALIEGAGFTVSRRTGSAAWAPGEVAFTSAIAKVYRRSGAEIAAAALKLMAAAFPAQRLVAGSSIFTATASLLTTLPPGFSETRMLTALRKYDMKGWAGWLAGAKGGDDRATRLKAVLLFAYEDVEREAAV